MGSPFSSQTGWVPVVAVYEKLTPFTVVLCLVTTVVSTGSFKFWAVNEMNDRPRNKDINFFIRLMVLVKGFKDKQCFLITC